MTTRRGRELDLDLDDVRRVDASLVGGDISVVAHPSAPRLEAQVLHGPPLSVHVSGGTVTIRHRRRWPLSWVGTRDAEASVVVFVPAECETHVRSVAAEVLVGRTHGGVDVRNVSGTLGLTGVSGKVVARNVSGAVEAENVTGQLTVKSVSGDVTASGALEGVQVRSVSGTVTLDLGSTSEVTVKSVSGDVSIRLAPDADVAVKAKSASGRFDSAFDVTGNVAGGRVSGRVGAGTGTSVGAIKVATVSGDFALLRRDADWRPPEAEAV